MGVPLGRLERVPLRECWVREDSDFTPWLATAENLALLGEAIDLELEPLGTEQSVGPFRADIVCRLVGDDDRLVLIENQLERTDHSHLGQVVTYAAGLKATTMVWIAERFTPEHRAALDWLNECTGEDVFFFGLEVELWRIGDSPPAPKFNVVAQPNDWVKQVREASQASRALSETDRVKLEFWTRFAAFLEERGRRFKPPPSRPNNWNAWGIGRTGFSLALNVSPRDSKLEVWISILGGPETEAFFQLLRARAPALEAALDGPLWWKSTGKERKIGITTELDLSDPENWPRACEWSLAWLSRMDDVFRPVIRQLDSVAWTPPTDP